MVGDWEDGGGMIRQRAMETTLEVSVGEVVGVWSLVAEGEDRGRDGGRMGTSMTLKNSVSL